MNILKHKMDRSDSSHAILEVDSRIRKSKKIKAILEQDKKLEKCKVLDIGTGSGHIAHELSKSVKNMSSVDIVDERKEKKGYEFLAVKDESLPFDDETFDVVITNHVVEHTPDQNKHLSEIYRVLKPGGTIYLATTNKYWLTDPHYKLPFISWLPRAASSKYLKISQKKEWDIYPLSHWGVKKYFAQAEVINALPLLINTDASDTLDNMSFVTKMVRRLPDFTLVLTQYLSPTLIYIIKKPANSR